MSDDSERVGRPFSHVYLKRGAPQRDSARLRRRVAAWVDSELSASRAIAATRRLRHEIGAQISSADVLDEWLRKASLPDFLDALTHVGDAVREVDRSSTYGQKDFGRYREFLSRALREENLGYRLDERCGVRYSVDEEYEAGRSATLAALGDGRYAAARDSFEAAFKHLGHPLDTRAAVEMVWDACENVFKLLLGDRVSRLGAKEIGDQLKPLALLRASGTERTAVNLMLNSFADWVNAGHHYRHSPGAEDPEPPSVEFAVLMLSTGAAFLRWLAELDGKTKADRPVSA